jgi:hypothetical protein
VTCYTQSYKTCKVKYILDYLPQGDASSTRGRWGVYAPALHDVLTFNRSSDSECTAPTFMQAKKTGDVRILTDFRRLNAQTKRKPFALPKISDLFRKLSGFKYATEIYLSMENYHIPWDLEAQNLCSTILPRGKNQYKRLPMGVKTSPDIFQRKMYELLGDIPNIQVYLDDFLMTSN